MVEKCMCSHMCVGEDGRCWNIAACAEKERVVVSLCRWTRRQSTSAVFAQTWVSIRRRRQRRLTRPWTRCRYCLSASTNHSRFILHILTEDSGPQMCRLQKLQEFVCVYHAQSTKLLMINQSCLLWSGFLMMQPSLFFKYQESHVLHLDTFACQKGLNSTNT